MLQSCVPDSNANSQQVVVINQMAPQAYSADFIIVLKVASWLTAWPNDLEEVDLSGSAFLSTQSVFLRNYPLVRFHQHSN